MNKAELIDAMAADANLTKADAKRALDAFVGATTKSLKKGDRVALVGFGSWSISSRSERTGRNGCRSSMSWELYKLIIQRSYDSCKNPKRKKGTS